MVKYVKSYERDFRVCSDCAYFIDAEIIDEKYPMIKKGRCRLHDKNVDNRWECSCKDNTYLYCCEQCQYFCENYDYDPEYDDDKYTCEFKDIPIDESSSVCEHFKSSYY